VHIRERAEWAAVLKTWEDRVAGARRQAASRPDQAAAAVQLAQMSGAVDQIREAARRLPMEVGDIYAEDRFRLELAVSALERLFARWGK
jgi:thioredoxin-like negative regulator of GroEL